MDVTFLILVAFCNMVGMGLYHGIVCAGKFKKDGWLYEPAKLGRTVCAGVIQLVSCVIFPWKAVLNLDAGPTYQFLCLSIVIGCGAAVLIDHSLKIIGWTNRK